MKIEYMLKYSLNYIDKQYIYNILKIKSFKYYMSLVIILPNMSYFDILPRHIVDYIYRIRDDYYANKIIKHWYSHIGKKIVAIEFLTNLQVETLSQLNNFGILTDNVFSQVNINRIKYIERHITENENHWWRNMIEKIGINYVYLNINNTLTLEEKTIYNKIISIISIILTKYPVYPVI